MKEMTPLEAAEILESKYNIHGPLKTVTEELEARAMAASFLRKIANGEIREAVHGKWNRQYKSGTIVSSGFVCSACDCWGSNSQTNYCPRCGAKMGDCHE